MPTTGILLSIIYKNARYIPIGLASVRRRENGGNSRSAPIRSRRAAWCTVAVKRAAVKRAAVKRAAVKRAAVKRAAVKRAAVNAGPVPSALTGPAPGFPGTGGDG
jgi:hypothetical protein